MWENYKIEVRSKKIDLNVTFEEHLSKFIETYINNLPAVLPGKKN
jgi:hypothetical protein